MRILRAADRAATPWKNGGGETREVAAWPPGAGFDDFDWRISMATVRSDGPFSVFPGVDRILAVIEGAGLQLTIGAATPLQLDTLTPPTRFSGDAACTAALLAGPVRDLNVMIRRGRFDARVRRDCVVGSTAVVGEADETLIVALDPLALAEGPCLDRDDALSLTRGCAARLQAASARTLVVTLKRLAPGDSRGCGKAASGN